MTNLTNIFVYGTLKKGEVNHEHLKGQILLGEGQTAEHFAMFDLGAFPIVMEAEVSSIHGEMYRVDEKVMENIDHLSGELFDRIVTPIKLEYYGTVDAWMYVEASGMETDEGVLINEGRWAKNTI